MIDEAFASNASAKVRKVRVIVSIHAGSCNSSRLRHVRLMENRIYKDRSVRHFWSLKMRRVRPTKQASISWHPRSSSEWKRESNGKGGIDGRRQPINRLALAVCGGGCMD